MERTIKSDAGAMIRDGVKSVAKQGCCHESLWPYITAALSMRQPVARAESASQSPSGFRSQRGICPSCGTRRMAGAAAHLVDCVIPKVPVRQWVLSFPIPLRSLFAVHPELLAPVLQIIHRAIATFLIEQTGISRTEAATGAVTLIQRFGSAANGEASRAPCANAHGFSLHAGVRCAADDRQGIEQLCRYIARPAIANERLSVNRAGQAVLKFKTAWRDGTSHRVMTPMEFMQRLAALVPRPRLHLIRFHGVLAPNAKLRKAVVPTQTVSIPAYAGDCTAAQPPPRAPARRVDLLQAA